ncbi:MAG: M16 family metallopeptidase [Candidatus Berkiellales bacterium]
MEKPITKEHQLDNGLKIVVREDHRAPVVVSQIWYKVGSADEYRWITGISHALEHMMFHGTPSLPKDGFAELISRFGGRNNAFTAEDFTAYYEELDAANLAISFEAEADRMSNLSLPAEAFAKEIQVVIEERRLRTDDNPQSVTWERFMAVANPMGPYHHPVIGWQVDLDAMRVDDLREWYHKWYAPNNAIIVVVGNVKPEEVFQLAQKYFGNIPSRQLPWVRSQKEIEPLGERRVKVHLSANVPYAIWGFDVPSLKTAENPTECYALAVASALLDGGESSRFSRELIRGHEIAASANTYYDPFKRYGTQFVLSGIPAHNHTIAELEEKVMVQIEKLKTEIIPDVELQKVKTQLFAQVVFDKDSMSDQATMLGLLESVGLPWQLLDEFPEKVQAITANDVQMAAKKYFQTKHLTAAELVPEKITG